MARSLGVASGPGGYRPFSMIASCTNIASRQPPLEHASNQQSADLELCQKLDASGKVCRPGVESALELLI